MPTSLTAAKEALRNLDRETLESVACACAESHLAFQRLTGFDHDFHPGKDFTCEQVRAMTTEKLVEVLTPFATLGQLVHQHHPEHEAAHGEADRHKGHVNG